MHENNNTNNNSSSPSSHPQTTSDETNHTAEDVDAAEALQLIATQRNNESMPRGQRSQATAQTSEQALPVLGTSTRRSAAEDKRMRDAASTMLDLMDARLPENDQAADGSGMCDRQEVTPPKGVSRKQSYEVPPQDKLLAAAQRAAEAAAGRKLKPVRSAKQAAAALAQARAQMRQAEAAVAAAQHVETEEEEDDEEDAGSEDEHTAGHAGFTGFGPGFNGANMGWMINNNFGGMATMGTMGGMGTLTSIVPPEQQERLSSLIDWLECCPLGNGCQSGDMALWNTALSSMPSPPPIIPLSNQALAAFGMFNGGLMPGNSLGGWSGASLMGGLPFPNMAMPGINSIANGGISGNMRTGSAASGFAAHAKARAKRDKEARRSAKKAGGSSKTPGSRVAGADTPATGASTQIGPDFMAKGADSDGMSPPAMHTHSPHSMPPPSGAPAKSTRAARHKHSLPDGLPAPDGAPLVPADVDPRTLHIADDYPRATATNEPSPSSSHHPTHHSISVGNVITRKRSSPTPSRSYVNAAAGEMDIESDPDEAARRILKGRYNGAEVTKDTLQSLFLLPIKDAADSLGMGVTLLKRVCRCYNIHRWPQRKLTSLDKLIDQFEGMTAPEGRVHLERLKAQRAAIFDDPNVDLDEYAKKLRQASLKAQHTARVKMPGGLEPRWRDGADSDGATHSDRREGEEMVKKERADTATFRECPRRSPEPAKRQRVATAEGEYGGRGSTRYN